MRRRIVLAFLAAALACAAPPARAEAGDPLEGVNRRVHAFNRLAQVHVLGPAADLYRAAAPPAVRRGVGNALANLREPVTALSALAAGDLGAATNAAVRFGVNSTLGLGGVRDRAAEMGHPRRVVTPADALCRRGVPSGPYLVLPLLGPSTLRDAGATAAAGAALSAALGGDAVTAWTAGEAFHDYAEGGAREALEGLERHSLDAYAALRSAHRQRRAAVCAVDRAAAAPVEEEDAAEPAR